MKEFLIIIKEYNLIRLIFDNEQQQIPLSM